MEFKSFSEASAELNKYRNLTGIIIESFNKKIYTLFVGVSDEVMSTCIYLGIRELLPLHTFTTSDLQSIDFWIGFYDNTITRLQPILDQDEYLSSLCAPNALYHEVNITEKWSEPIRIPKGLGFWMTFYNDKEIWYKIFNNDLSSQHTITRIENAKRLFRYNNHKDEFALEQMKEPLISFKMPDNNEGESKISLLFVNE